ncbi:MAG: phage minor capsid protein, partial [Lactobacillus sp.]|nr:phage minor capsid protein [Lactobacillus sp.]
MATKDMLSAGLNCVEYANGARHTLSDYADMAIRTACKRAYLTGEGEKRKEWGISTVIMNKRGNPCPKCLPWVGKIMIDDVWSGGKKSDGDYPLMSAAVAAGLYHPRCKDGHTTYFEGISTPPDSKFTQQELLDIEQQNKDAAEQQYAKRQQQKYGRLAEYSLDAENRKKYQTVADNWIREGEKLNKELDVQRTYRHFVKKIRSGKSMSPHRDRMAMYAEFTELIEDNQLLVPFAYDLSDDVIKYNPNAPHIAQYNLDYVFAHEVSHRMDVLEYRSWENEKFLKAIDRCSLRVY